MQRLVFSGIGKYRGHRENKFELKWMQKGCKRVRTCESKFEWEIRDYASGVQLVCLNSAKTKPGMGDLYWYEWSVGQW